MKRFVFTAQGPRARIEDAAFVGDDMLVVCDGMGGMVDGHLASAAGVAWARQGLPLGETMEGASAAVEQAAGRRSGTTFTLARRVGATIQWIHTGDSALWVLYRGNLTRLTTAHTMWDAARERGGSVPRAAKSQLLSSLPAVAAPVTWDTGLIPVHPGSWIFGTTDGFYDVAEDEEGVVVAASLLRVINKFLLGTAAARATAATRQRMLNQIAEKTRDNATIAGWAL